MSSPRLPFRPRRTGAMLFAASILLWTGCSDFSEQAPTGPDVQELALGRPSAAELAAIQDFGPARAVARARTPALLDIPGVVGTGVGLNNAGRPAVKVFLAHDQVQGIPDRLDGVPVARVVTGLFVAWTDRTAPTRPAPIGFSIGHPDVTAGTLGARVTDGTNVFILSNNHVIANGNNASIGDPILQPGAYDGGSEPGDVIGTLHAYQEISFNGPNNTMDAAISIVNANDVSGATPTDEGYGAPGTTVIDPSLGLNVQKYGRTTGHTFGQVAEIDVTVNVCYAGWAIFCTSMATFVDQISITPGDFSDGGDSGSLIVTNGNGNNPVGLLFAGSNTRTIANPIGPVLDHFGVTIDPTIPEGGGGGGGGGEDPNNPPTADFTANCTDLACTLDASEPSGSSDSDGSIVSWQWDFGDGSIGSGEVVNHTYADATRSPYTVILTVTDDDDATDVASQQVAVSESGGGGGGGNTAPQVNQFVVSTRTTGPWSRADVTWSVSDVDGDLAQVTSTLVDASGNVLDFVTDLVNDSDASGQHGLQTRSGTPDAVVLVVSDASGNITTEEIPY